METQNETKTLVLQRKQVMETFSTRALILLSSTHPSLNKVRSLIESVPKSLQFFVSSVGPRSEQTGRFLIPGQAVEETAGEFFPLFSFPSLCWPSSSSSDLPLSLH